MSVHIGAKEGQIAEKVLLPGDPLRAKFIAENFLENAVCHNEIRGMYGFTGTYKGKPVSVQGTGMGIPSMSIYATELMAEYNVKTLIRIGTCGGIAPDVKLKDVILAMNASTDSNINKLRFKGFDYSACANYELLKKAETVAVEKGANAKVGHILTSDSFYSDYPHDEEYRKNYLGNLNHLCNFGISAVEMETVALYTLAPKFNAKALAILTVSDHIIREERTTAEERQYNFMEMVKIALEV